MGEEEACLPLPSSALRTPRLSGAVGVGKETYVFSSRTPSLIHSLELSGAIGRVPKHCHIDGGDIETKKRSDDPNKGGDVDTFIIQLGLEL
jgi:hypothetical protein